MTQMREATSASADSMQDPSSRSASARSDSTYQETIRPVCFYFYDELYLIQLLYLLTESCRGNCVYSVNAARSLVV